MTKFCKALTRRKKIGKSTETQLARVLNLFDLTTLGVGNTLGLGIYVLAGRVAYDVAGPAVIISFIIAAIASVFAGFCYAEFASRVPEAGSAYIYSYVTIGEFVAFTMGWNIILQALLGTASVARGLCDYIDSLFNDTMTKTLKEWAPINVPFLSPYPALLPIVFVVILTILLIIGVKESTILNNIFTSLNMLTLLVVIVAGGLNAHFENWSIPQDQVPEGFGTGGFMPFGFAGIMVGAVKCFYGFIGFDCIACMGEEAIKPKRDIPLAIILSLIIIFLTYLFTSVVLTMMLPYYKQHPNAPFPSAFEQIDWIIVKWIVTIGAIFGLSTSMLCSMLTMPRIIYAMGLDGLLCRSLAIVSKCTKTPILATLVSGILITLFSVFLDLDQLMDLMSICTLQCYCIVAICVIVLRYEDEGDEVNTPHNTCTIVLCQCFIGGKSQRPNRLSSNIVKFAIFLFLIFCIIWCSLHKFLDMGSIPGIIALSTIGFILFWISLTIDLQPQAEVSLIFKVPLVPYLPCLSIFLNLFLMFETDFFTWCRLGICMIIGYIIYFSYGINFRILSLQKTKENILLSRVFEPD